MTDYKIQELKRRYPAGTRLKCLYIKDVAHPIPYGTLGTVKDIDDVGHINVRWDNGCEFALNFGQDAFDVIRSKRDEI